ncbi:MAG: molybdopterin molybdenumtransferase MoeA [Rhodospirillales bacterium]|nr:molybdopterin molybdenumtransferase MoeA [Rhodospirillales bacterium]
MSPNHLSEALTLIAARVEPVTEIEHVALTDAIGRALATDIRAALTLPPFDNTGVDGWAFRRGDVTAETNARLRVAGESAAGIPFAGELPAGGTTRISTGAVIPNGADTVVMQEDCERDGDAIVLRSVPKLGAHIRRAGEDIRAGDVALAAGRRLAPQDLALLLSLGERDAPVRRKLRVGIISTGTELRTLDDGKGPPLSGQIFDSNRPMLAAMLRRWPVDIETLPILRDDRGATERALLEASARFDLLLTTGGVSVGDHDHVRPSVEALGEILFWRLSIRPGRPVLLGRVGNAHVLGLPGNPVSVAVIFALLGRAVLSALAGFDAPRFVRLPVALDSAHTKPARLNEFVRARIENGRAVLYRAQGSNLLTSLAWSDGLCDLPAGRDAFAPGDVVDFLPFSGLFD